MQEVDREAKTIIYKNSSTLMEELKVQNFNKSIKKDFKVHSFEMTQKALELENFRIKVFY